MADDGVGGEDEPSEVDGSSAPQQTNGALTGGASSSDAAQAARRDTLKKAAAAAGVAAATWVAPRIDGLSIRPDYAAAGTARGTFGPFQKNLGPNNGTSNFNVPTPAGTEPISAVYSGDDVNGNITVSFNSMDQPWNSNCRVSSFGGSATFGVGNVRFNSTNNTTASWDIYNPFWGNTNTAGCNQLNFTIIC